ncbi:MAG: alpha/beta fold hydrolase [Burkholderiaceae bacterium]
MSRSTSFRLLSRALIVAAVVWIAGCGEDDPVAGDVVEKQAVTLTGASSASSVQRIVYRMPAVGGGLHDAKALVMIPAGPAPSGGWPVLAWGHGTTGIADACAPSATADLAGYLPYLNALVAQGYAVVAPDYEGLGTSGLHPYLSLASEGRSLVYAVLAATRGFGSLSTRYALIGHSQGGHAVLGAADLAGEVSGLTLVGTVAIAPASNIRASGDQLQAVITNNAAPIGDRVAAGVGRLLFSSLILGAIPATDASFDPASAFGSQASSLASAAVSQCLTDLSNTIAPLVQAEVTTNGSIDALLPPASLNIPAVSQYLQNNEPGTRAIAKPVLLLQGSADTTVFPAFTQLLNNTMTTAGTSSSYTEFAGETHSSIVQASAAAALAFLATSFATP